MLERLVQLRWLRRSGRDYELGMRLVELGSLARAPGPACIARRCRSCTNCTAQPAWWCTSRCWTASDVVYLEKVGDRMAAAIPTRVGGRHPAHCTAVGKAILAESGDDVLEPLSTDLLPRKTKYSISTTSQLRTELNKVRAHGVAFDREESLAGFGCVAASIGTPGDAVGAVSVCGPMNRMTFDQRLVAPVRMAALGIWRQHRRQCGTGRPDPAADARAAHRPGRPRI